MFWLKIFRLEEEDNCVIQYKTDRGYCWVVLASSFLLFLISLISPTASGMLYVEFLDAFPGQEKATLWACSLASSLQFLGGNIAYNDVCVLSYHSQMKIFYAMINHRHINIIQF